MKKLSLLFTFFLFTLTLLKAQNQQQYTLPNQNMASHPRAYDTRKSFWTEYNLQGNITENKKWQYQLDIQYRRSADASFVPGGSKGNIFKDPYQQVYRPWIHYWAIPGVLRLSLSPIGYWGTWTPSSEGFYYQTADRNSTKAFYSEFRTCPQVTLNNTTGRFTFSNRIRYEFRWIGNRIAANSNAAADIFDGDSYHFGPGGVYGSNHKGRMRWQIRAQVLLNSQKMEKNTVYLNMWNELFISMGRHVKYNENLDQNRTVALLGYKLPFEYPIRVEGGVTIQQLFNAGSANKIPVSGTTFKNAEVNTAYTIYVIFDDFHKFLKKKKVDTIEQVK